MAKPSPEILYISAMLRTQDHTHSVKTGITPEYFDAYRSEWEWLEKYVKRHGRTPSKTSFRAEFPDCKVYATDELDHYSDELREAMTRRGVVEMLTQAADVVTKGTLSDAIDLLNAGAKRLQVQSQTASRETSVIDDWSMIYDTVAEKQKRAKENGNAGVPTGFPTIDLASGGTQPGELWIYAARLGQGKSWTLMRMAVEAINNGNTVLYNALEQSRSQVALRVQNIMSKGRFRANDLNKGKVDSLEEYREFLEELRGSIDGRLIVSDKPRITPEYLASQIERHNPQVVFIDYLTLMKSGKGGASSKDWLAVADLSAELKAIAEEYEIPIISAAQINRMGTSKKEAPGTEHVAYADAIGQDADGLVTMTRSSMHLMKCRFAKYRNGPDGDKFNLEFNPGKGIIEEVSNARAEAIVEEDAAAEEEY